MDSGLAFIDVKHSDPFKLYNAWENEVIRYRADGSASPRLMCLATSTKDGQVSNRTLVIEDVLSDGFILFTDKRSRKISEIEQNPRVAATVLWSYSKNGSNINRQVRFEGTVTELSREESKKYQVNKPLYCKIRSHICHQGQEVNWEDLEKTHYYFYTQVQKHKELTMPYHEGAYKITPHRMEFYYAFDNHIGDRVLFTKQQDDMKSNWKFVHLAA